MRRRTLLQIRRQSALLARQRRLWGVLLLAEPPSSEARSRFAIHESSLGVVQQVGADSRCGGDPALASLAVDDAEKPEVRRREWTDDAGRVWRRRGEMLTRRRARALMDSPATTVLVFGGPSPVRVEHADRAALRDRVAPFLDGRPSDAVGQEDYEAAEFVDEARQRLLVLYEYC